MTVSRWDWHYRDFGALLCGPEMLALMDVTVQKLKAAAEAIAPIGDSHEDDHPGLYRSSFETETGVASNGLPGKRAYGRLTNTAPYAAAVEWGNRRAPAQHVMARALDHVRG